MWMLIFSHHAGRPRMGTPETPPHPFGRGSHVGRRSITSAGFLADIFGPIPRNALLSVKLARKLRDHELRRIAERACTNSSSAVSEP
jgi:hypothetical protein